MKDSNGEVKFNEFDEMQTEFREKEFREIRRSTRKPAKQIEEEKRAQWKQYLKEERIDG